MQWLAVALGGALGAISRYGIGLWLPNNSGQFPWSTLIVNVAGSIVVGFLYVLITEKGLVPDQWRPLLSIGFLGALTTFSAFSLDAVLLWQAGQIQTGVIYILASVIACLLAAAGSVWMAQKIF